MSAQNGPNKPNKALKSPYPYFGGKSKVAAEVWRRFGDVPNYVEPFFGSGAVLLLRPGEPGTETVNDLDGMVSNFWRALQSDPDSVAYHADWPVNENDLHARHIWLVGAKDSLRGRLEGDPEYYDAKIAGWWVWGICAWIGSGFCSGAGPWHVEDGVLVKQDNGGNRGKNINRKRPHLGNRGVGINRKLPHLGDRGQGINRQLPHLSRGRGINRQRPNLGNRGEWIAEYFVELAARLRDVRVCCGDWARVCGPTVTTKQGLTGVFLDPPYLHSAGRDTDLYSEESATVANDVREWAIEHGDDPLMRIALCGYDGEHIMPDSWDMFAWKTGCGYSSKGGRGEANSHRERIWFSPHCLSQANADADLFGDIP